jgi:murein DD-endopeptidase MepM/ murein hydrolase activator NlpD
LLGQFTPTIKNLETVKSGQKIGVTQSDSTSGLGGGKIYFEVRKNNLAQNTYLLLDKKTVSKTVIR